MMKNGNRILTYALVLSLLAHLLVAAIFRPIKNIEAKPEQRPQTFRIFHISTPPPPTPQPTKPPVTKPEKPRPTHAAAPAPPKTKTVGSETTTEHYAYTEIHGDGAPASPGPSVAPSTPEPTPTPKPACSVPNAPATTVNVVAPVMPPGVENVGKAEAQVRVTLEASGAIEGVEIYRPTGYSLLDREALRAARQSTYRPEIRDCVYVGGQYLFTVDFTE